MTLARLVVADDHLLVADAIAKTFSSCCEIVGVVNSSAEVLALLTGTTADWLFLDHQLGDGTGLDLMPAIRSLAATMRVVVLTVSDCPFLAADYRRVGASGFFYKGDRTAELVRLVGEGPRGDFFMSATPRRATGQVIRGDPDRFDLLGAPTREVLRLLGQGRTSQEIAVQIGRGVDDVSYHRKRIRTLLGVRTQAELIRCALELELRTTRPAGLPSELLPPWR